MEYRFLLQSTMVESAIAWVAKNIPYVASLWYLSIFFIILLWGTAERCSRIFKIASVQETSKIVMRYSLEVLNVFITLLLKHNFRKYEIFFLKWSTVFYFKVLRLKAHHFLPNGPVKSQCKDKLIEDCKTN